MLKLQIQYIGPIRNVVKKSDETLSIDEGLTVRDVMIRLVRSHSKDLRAELFTVDGGLRPEIQILLNGRNIEHINGLDTKLFSNSSLHVLFMLLVVSGG